MAFILGCFSFIHSFIQSFIPVISIAPLQVLYYSEALPTTARILYRSFTPKRTGNCRLRICPRSLRGSESGSRTHDPSVESHRLNQGATTYLNLCCLCCVLYKAVLGNFAPRCMTQAGPFRVALSPMHSQPSSPAVHPLLPT